jgi:NAD-dependent deacetylase
MEELHAALADADFVVAFTGAGASADSGIPTFRGNAAAYWAGPLGWPVLALYGTPLGWRVAPWTAWPLFDRFMRRPIVRAAPNPAHTFLGELARRGCGVRVVTQNVDGLHQRGGVPAEHVAEVHGTVWRSVCIRCRATLQETAPCELPDAPDVGYCACGGWPRPAATLFTEMVPPDAVAAAVDFVLYDMQRAARPVVLIVGLSGTVPTSNSLISLARSIAPAGRAFNINPGWSLFSDATGVVQVGRPAGEVFAELQAES